ncbi:MAG: serine/threonine protein kinase [Deltaproteobacteria bacterium]|nr:serine/threonine protein kinase [Deltaproteobacteria bacterium]
MRKKSTLAERAELKGQVLDGRYRINDILGIGGTSIAFDALRLSDGSHVVVKVLRPGFVDNPDLVRRLRREAEVARRVAHPAIVSVLDEGILSGFPGADGSPYLVFERVWGESLQRLLRRTGTLDAELVAAIALRVASALHIVHQEGYVHRDIKPEHIWIERERDGALRIRLLDFGVCASADAPPDEREREVGRVFGTPSYCSPEQAAGNPNVDARTDVFGLGVVMFEAISGRLPFVSTSVSNLLRRIIREDAPRLGRIRQDLPPAYDEVVAKALARDPAERFPSMRAFARALGPLVGARASIDARLRGLIRSEPPLEDAIPTRPLAGAV